MPIGAFVADAGNDSRHCACAAISRPYEDGTFLVIGCFDGGERPMAAEVKDAEFEELGCEMPVMPKHPLALRWYGFSYSCL